jgi:hypothetical protein
MPIKVKAKPGEGNLSKSLSLTKGKAVRRNYKYIDVHSGEEIDADVPMPAPAGPKTILRKEIADKIIGFLEKGNYISTSVEAAGISIPTFLTWMHYGSLEVYNGLGEDKRKYKKYRIFHKRVKKAIAASETQLLSRVEQAARTGQWAAAAWMLERKNFRKWGKKQYTATEFKGELKVSHDITRRILDDPVATAKAIDVFESVTETSD